MNYSLVIRIVGVLACLMALLLLVPALVALLYGEMSELRVFLQVAGPAAAGGGVLLLLKRGTGFSLTSHDGFLVVALAWLTMALIGAVPFVLSGAIPGYTDAFFETMSGFTTTGATILNDIEALPRSLLFWRSFTHWLGGMGIIVLTVAIFPLLGFKGLQLVRAEAPGPSVDKLTPKIAHSAKILWMLYIGLSLAETLLLLAAGMDLFDALTHTFGTMATGGFSPRNASVAAYDSAAIDAIITVFMLLAGVNFVLYYSLLTRRFDNLRRDTELKVYLGIFAAATLMTTLVLFRTSYDSLGESLRFASFQVASILTTTGYATADYLLWPTAAMAVVFLLMFVGGSAGSTGGGIKVVRLTALFKQGMNEMKYLLHPRGVFTPQLNRAPLRKSMVLGIAGFVFLYLLLLLITTLVVALSGSSLLTSFSTALATLGNIGPGFDAIGPTENYAAFPDWLKWYLSFIMLTGRLEVYTILILFTPRYWQK
ncbi:TrkH family potassium uptake protein [Spirochaeta africana]|uniref:Trk-type K+ transport system, membrane component n=1 Tax=Spirochaeta africana (strain ATCC 700263 / DSM 8902 / Z-7692) TaxID=889378 RepID=H9UGH6_SPIAZ|nr:potassium transporter TrkG [Spirochaeta africana]AFG36619.1 Trk-type K+ transport system, membrane component [Spirochaeta africana DSM 8902]